MTAKAEDSDQRSAWVTVGLAVTALYAIGFLMVVWSPWAEPGNGLVTRGALTLNEVGDLLAGAFAPLAFLWLLVAVMVQAQELGLQRQELKATREEMMQNRQVADLTRKEVAAQAASVGQQTEILVQQLVREERRAASDQFQILVQSAVTLLRSRFTGLHVYKGGEAQYALVRSDWFTGDDYRDLVIISSQMRRQLARIREKLDANELTLSTPGSKWLIETLLAQLRVLDRLAHTADHWKPFLMAVEDGQWREMLKWVSDLPETAT